MDILRKRQDSRDNGVHMLQMEKEAQRESDPAMAWMCHLKAMCGKQSYDIS